MFADKDLALLVALAASACTLIGYPISKSFAASGTSLRKSRTTAIALAASGVAMILVSAVELIPSALGLGVSALEAFAWLIGGLLAYVAFDKVVDEFGSASSKFKRSALTVAIALTLHNLPEGAAMVASEFAGLEPAVATAVALGVHNIPEGVAIALVALAAGFKPRTAAILVAISALAEALGAVSFWAFNFSPDARSSAITLLVVAALMIAISLVELLPRAFRTLAGASSQDLDK